MDGVPLANVALVAQLEVVSSSAIEMQKLTNNSYNWEEITVRRWQSKTTYVRSIG